MNMYRYSVPVFFVDSALTEIQNNLSYKRAKAIIDSQSQTITCKRNVWSVWKSFQQSMFADNIMHNDSTVYMLQI